MKLSVSSRGFTLIELLVVVAIIGILAAIAIPQYSAYRQRGFDSRASSDLRNAATAEEAYFATFGTYLAYSGDGPTVTPLPGLSLSAGVHLEIGPGGVITLAIGTPEGFTGLSFSYDGTGQMFRWDSLNGGMQPEGPLVMISEA